MGNFGFLREGDGCVGWVVCGGRKNFIVRGKLPEEFSVSSGRGVGAIDPDEEAVMGESFQHFGRPVPLAGSLASLVLHIHKVTRDEWLELFGPISQVFTFCIVSLHEAFFS